MSFSSELKEEMLKHTDSGRHCQLAELAVYINIYGSVLDGVLTISFDKKALYRKCFTLLKKTYNIENVSDIGYVTDREETEKSEIVIEDGKLVNDILRGIGASGKDGIFTGLGGRIDNTIIKNSCCKQAFIRANFLCSGSMNDPSKGYHLEIVCESPERAEQITQVLETFDIEAKIVCRKKYFVVYIKEGNSVVDFLGVCGASVSYMKLESLRVMKEMGNAVNRRVNCETANIARTAAAYNRLLEDIELIQRQYGFDKLPESLREMAEARLEYPEATLKELGEMMDPVVSKSCVNHRLRKLSEIAEQLR